MLPLSNWLVNITSTNLVVSGNGRINFSVPIGKREKKKQLQHRHHQNSGIIFSPLKYFLATLQPSMNHRIFSCSVAAWVSFWTNEESWKLVEPQRVLKLNKVAEWFHWCCSRLLNLFMLHSLLKYWHKAVASLSVPVSLALACTKNKWTYVSGLQRSGISCMLHR